MKNTTGNTERACTSTAMSVALDEAYAGIAAHHGGPFGSAVVRDGVIVGRGHNRVLEKRDPTCHGEIEAIRNACAQLGTADLSGCELYTTAEPCPMCLGAILWANIGTVHFGCTREDSAAIGFRDSAFYAMMDANDLSQRDEREREDTLEPPAEDTQVRRAERTDANTAQAHLDAGKKDQTAGARDANKAPAPAKTEEAPQKLSLVCEDRDACLALFAAYEKKAHELY